MNLVPTSELEAVNALLATISEAPVNTLTGELPTDAAMAKQLLHEKSRELQVKGWSFNQDLDLTLAAAQDGTVPLPSNALSVDVQDADHITQRGSKLYDRTKQTFSLGRAVKAHVTFFLPFNELPEYARQFLKISAGRLFQDRTLGDESLHRYTAQDEIEAWSDFMDAEVEQGDYNVLRHSPSVARIIRRRRPA